MVLLIFHVARIVVLMLMCLCLILFSVQMYWDRRALFQFAVHRCTRFCGTSLALIHLLFNMDYFGVFGIWSPSQIGWLRILTFSFGFVPVFVWIYYTLKPLYPFVLSTVAGYLCRNHNGYLRVYQTRTPKLSSRVEVPIFSEGEGSSRRQNPMLRKMDFTCIISACIGELCMCSTGAATSFYSFAPFISMDSQGAARRLRWALTTVVTVGIGLMIAFHYENHPEFSIVTMAIFMLVVIWLWGLSALMLFRMLQLLKSSDDSGNRILSPVLRQWSRYAIAQSLALLGPFGIFAAALHRSIGELGSTPPDIAEREYTNPQSLEEGRAKIGLASTALFAVFAYALLYTSWRKHEELDPKKQTTENTGGVQMTQMRKRDGTLATRSTTLHRATLPTGFITRSVNENTTSEACEASLGTRSHEGTVEISVMEKKHVSSSLEALKGTSVSVSGEELPNTDGAGSTTH